MTCAQGGITVTNSHSDHYGQPIAHVNGAHANGRHEEPLLKVSEVADLMNAHPNSVRRWADIGLLPSHRIGLRGDRRFEIRDVNDFLGSFDRYKSTFRFNGRNA